MKTDLIKVSKFLSYVLRYKPESIKIILSEQGWINIDELICAADKSGHYLTKDIIDEVVFSDDKQRFAYSEDGLSIRANQGHSIDVKLGLEPVLPPDILFHGTAIRFMKSIRKIGLVKKDRHHVHLSTAKETAHRVGSRHGKPIILEIDTKRMSNDGIKFFLSINGVWLVDEVHVKYINEL